MNRVHGARRRFALALGVAAFLWMGAARAADSDAADALASPPQPAAPRQLTLPVPLERSLGNGLRVVVAPRPGVHLATAQLLWLSGSEIDPPGRAGLAAFTATMLTKGNARLAAGPLARAAESLGGSLEASAGWHRSQLAMTVAVTQLDAALALLSESARTPRFDTPEIDRLRAQWLDDLKITLANPGAAAARSAAQLLFGDGAYGHPSGGTAASLPRLTQADLRALHAAVYRPENTVLILAGDLDPDTAFRLAQQHFGAWRAAVPADAGMAAHPVRAGEPLAAPGALVDMPGVGQAAVVVAVPLPRLDGAQRAAADVLSAVLGGGFSSRLNQEIRIRRGLSYGAGSALDLRQAGGMLRASVQTKSESAAEVLGLIRSELSRMASTLVDEPELSARKAALVGNFSRSVETTAGLAAAVADRVVRGEPLSELAHTLERLNAVPARAVQALAQEVLVPDRSRTVVAGEAAAITPTLQAQMQGWLRRPASNADADAAVGN